MEDYISILPDSAEEDLPQAQVEVGEFLFGVFPIVLHHGWEPRLGEVSSQEEVVA